MDDVETVVAGVALVVAAALLVAPSVLRRWHAVPRPRADLPTGPVRRGPEGWSVTVELALLWVDGGGDLRYRVRSARAPVCAAPDQVALDLADLPPDARGAVVHATSWRYEDAGHVVLTYAAVPSSPRAGDAVLVGVGVVSSTDPVRPRPPGLHQHHVVAHAARHLAYLAVHDPTVGRAAQAAPACWAALAEAVRAMPAGGHEDGHELARRWLA